MLLFFLLKIEKTPVEFSLYLIYLHYSLKNTSRLEELHFQATPGLSLLSNSLAAQPASSFGGEQGCVLSLFIGELACPQRAGVLYLSHTAS